MTDSDGRGAQPDEEKRLQADATRSPMPGEEDGAGGDGDDGAVDPRIHAAWREWLAALATDAEAAIAAAHVYAEIPPAARDAWLDALAEDHPKLTVPLVAIYAPLLSVETDPLRRARIERAMGGEGSPPRGILRAFRGIAEDGARIAALVAPLYLKFVRVLWCRYTPDLGFMWVRHDLILRDEDAPVAGSVVESTALESTPVKLVVEELAHAVLAQRRQGAAIPRSLQLFADMFDAQIEAESFA